MPPASRASPRHPVFGLCRGCCCCCWLRRALRPRLRGRAPAIPSSGCAVVVVVVVGSDELFAPARSWSHAFLFLGPAEAEPTEHAGGGQWLGCRLLRGDQAGSNHSTNRDGKRRITAPHRAHGGAGGGDGPESGGGCCGEA